MIISVLICYSDYGVCFHMLILCAHTRLPLNYGKASAAAAERATTDNSDGDSDKSKATKKNESYKPYEQQTASASDIIK